MDKLKCPACGSTNIRFDVRPAGTKSKSNYYRTGIKDSWILPVGQKTYKSNRRYKTVCLCQNCGNLWERKNPMIGSVIKAFILLTCLAIYIAVIAAIFSSDPELIVYRKTYIGVALAMTIGFIFVLWKEAVKHGKEG